MGFLKRLLGFGTTVAGTVAAVKVSEKVKENNPNGVQDVNGDGKVDYKDYVIETKKAAKETYDEFMHERKAAQKNFKEGYRFWYESRIPSCISLFPPLFLFSPKRKSGKKRHSKMNLWRIPFVY